MSDYDRILELADGDLVKLGREFKEHIHKRLNLGHSRWLVRHGILGNHECFSPPQKYYQAIRELWSRSQEMQNKKASAMEAQADLIEAQEKLDDPGFTNADKLRAEASVLRAKTKLTSALVGAEDMQREMDELNKVRLELQDAIEKRYPGGIEDASPDIWRAVLHARMKGDNPGERVDNIPLDDKEKVFWSQIYGRKDLRAPAEVQKMWHEDMLQPGIEHVKPKGELKDETNGDNSSLERHTKR